MTPRIMASPSSGSFGQHVFEAEDERRAFRILGSSAETLCDGI
jgi:hypothetical protein